MECLIPLFGGIFLVSSIFSMVRFVWFSWQRRGFFFSARMALAELIFEFRYGTETITMRSLPQMTDVKEKSKIDSHLYQASYAHLFHKIFRKLERHHNISGAFIDIGAGKCRAMMLAALYGFEKIYGVEFSQDLCLIGENNMKKFTRNRKGKIDYSVINDNAVNYSIPTDVSVVYMANPFGELTMLHVLDNIEQSLMACPRELFIAYYNPQCSNLMIERNYKILFEERDQQGTMLYQVYTVTPENLEKRWALTAAE